MKKALEQKTTEATELAKKVEALNLEINNINNARGGYQREVRAKQAQLQNLEKQKKHAETRLGNVRSAIKQEEERVFSDTQKEKNERMDRVHELQTELKERQKDEANVSFKLQMSLSVRSNRFLAVDWVTVCWRATKRVWARTCTTWTRSRRED